MGKQSQRRLSNMGANVPGRDLAELEGYVDLGMKRDALRVPRQFLKSNRIRASSFNSALNAILIQADRLKNWRALIERAYARLAKKSRHAARPQMLALYRSVGDWKSADDMLPARPRNAMELLFSMETLLNLCTVSDAKRIQRKCRRMLNSRIDAISAAALLHTLASYYAQIGELGAAEEYWGKVSEMDSRSKSI